MAKRQTGYRLQPQTLLKLHLYARLDGVSYNAALDQAIHSWAGDKQIQHGVSWRDFESPEPGYMECMMYKRSDVALNEHEQEERRFVAHHRSFFYREDGLPNIRNLRVLWPMIDAYVTKWHEQVDTWAVGEAMAAALKKAKLPAPEWGPHTEDSIDASHS